MSKAIQIVLIAVWYLHNVGASTLMKELISSETAPMSSSLSLGSLIECQGWAQTVAVHDDAISYDKESGKCSVHDISINAVYEAAQQPNEVGHSYYINSGLICDFCGLKPGEYLPDLYYYVPLGAQTGTSMNVKLYFTSSLSEYVSGTTIPLWDTPFFDGNYPIWTSDTPNNFYIYQLHSNIVISSMSAFAWANFDSAYDAPLRPVVGLHKQGNYKGGFILGAGHTNLKDKLSFLITDDANVPHALVSDEAVIQTRVWQHIGATYDSATGECHLYYNGESIKTGNLGSGIQTHVLNWLLFNTGWTIDGTGGELPSRNCQGCASIHHEVYERALTPDEVAQVYFKHKCYNEDNNCN